MVLLAIDEKNPAVVAIRLKHVETLQLPWDLCWGAFSHSFHGWHQDDIFCTFRCFLKWWYPPKWMVYNGKHC